MNSTELDRILNQSGELTLCVKGNSMRPFLSDERDYVIVKPVDRITRGDIVFYRGPFDRPVMHRVIECKNGILTLRGDGNSNNDMPVVTERVFGRVTGVIINKREYSENSAVFSFYRSLALSRFFRAGKRTDKFFTEIKEGAI